MPEYKLRVLKMGQADVPGPEVSGCPIGSSGRLSTFTWW